LIAIRITIQRLIRIFNSLNIAISARIGVSEIPLEANLEVKKFKHLRSDMGDPYVVFCIDLHTGDEYNLIVTEGLVYDHLEAIHHENNPFRFNIKRILDPERGQYIISINETHNWVMLH